MPLTKEERVKVAEQITKVANLLEKVQKVSADNTEVYVKKASDLISARRRYVNADLPDAVTDALANAPVWEVRQVAKDVLKIKKETFFMMPSLMRLSERLERKLGLPMDSWPMQALDKAANAIADLQIALEQIEKVSGYAPEEQAAPAAAPAIEQPMPEPEPIFTE